MKKHIPLSELTDAGRAWAERQHRAGAPDTWLATWREAVALELAPDDPRHELAKFVVVAARERWRELRPGAPRTATSPTRKSRSGTVQTDAERRARGEVRVTVPMPVELRDRIAAHGPVATVARVALEAAFPPTPHKK